jgi:HK97 family phage major capsid protein
VASIERSGASALIPEEVSNIILKDVQNKSAAMSLFRRLPMGTNQTRLRILAALPQAYWVDGDTGLKQTTSIAWDNKFLVAEELAAIVPIPEALLDDVDYDVWGAVQPLLSDAIAIALDAAVFFETNKPASFPTGIVAGAVAASHVVVRGTAAADAGGVPADISNAFSKVEEDGFAVSGIVANQRYKGLLRNARDGEGRQLNEVNSSQAYGVGIDYAMEGQWPTGTSQPEFIAGDFSHGILGVRTDVTYKLLDQAALFNPDGTVQYNLPQQDMVALRVMARFGFQTDNTINRTKPTKTDATRYPWAVINSPAG